MHYLGGKDSMKKMKKMLSAVLVCAVAVLTVGCGQKEQSATLYKEQNGIRIESTYDAVGDRVMKITQTTTVSLENYNEDQKKQFESTCEQAEKLYDEVEGTTYQVTMTDSKMVEVLTIDASKPETLQELNEKNLLPIEGNASALSFKKSIENLKSQGWTIKE